VAARRFGYIVFVWNSDLGLRSAATTNEVRFRSAGARRNILRVAVSINISSLQDEDVAIRARLNLCHLRNLRIVSS
jgi:hypothetical protein